MPTKFEHSARFSASVATVYTAFSSAEYWQRRVADVGGPIARIDEFAVRDDGVHVALMQGVAEEFLPSIVTKVRPGDLEIDRTEHWRPAGPDGSASGTFTAAIPGVPATIGGTLGLSPDGAGSRLSIRGDVEIKVPLIGGKIEKAAIDQLVRLLESEDEFTSRWTTTPQ
ncbi:MAG TPA: DUF2505 domain-containing protein [Aldersonia sp.]